MLVLATFAKKPYSKTLVLYIQTMPQPQICTFREKESKSLRNVTYLYFITTFTI